MGEGVQEREQAEKVVLRHQEAKVIQEDAVLQLQKQVPEKP